MSKKVLYRTLPMVWPIERQRIRRTRKELEEMSCEDESTDIWKENRFDKYEKRPEEMDEIMQAKFVAHYTRNTQGNYLQRKEPRVIRYRNYDIAIVVNEYKREMVTLNLQFINEELLADMKFIQRYDDNEQLILERRKEFESNLDIQKHFKL
ncbi:helitron_like_N domain-containing protein [Trichonephila inaurata madagascariensis]|uniref:Helitron_like_N domain-containing protein n=1 Tax=Trichonephila inaurata madagascariensis TaxID=2747483 RepID=A0A8X7C362_9ARAC|nr:helitron_like_N domain-containing protein [Trichonephila inaurata madagascariensis]